jgi:DNA (cytosine-5)-methyltransferase 1
MFELRKTGDLQGFRFADFFAGIGGFHLALAARGAQCVFACEKDDDAAGVYERNFSLRPHGDIQKVQAEIVPAHDILTAGFPCQPFSRAGKGLGLDDPRGKLFWDLLRIIEYRKPPVVLLENVPGLLTHAKGRSFKTIRTAIEGLGYVVHTQLVNAAESWVPQNRERVFILCFRTDIAPSRLVSVPPSLFNYTVAEVVEDYLEREISAIERPFDPSNPYVENRKSDGDPTKLQRLGGYGKQRQGMRVYDANGRGVTLGSQGGGAGALTGLYKLRGGNIRKLTKLETQRMAGFPDSFVAHDNEITAQRQFGNAVVPTAVDRVLVTVIAAIKDAGLRPVAESKNIDLDGLKAGETKMVVNRRNLLSNAESSAVQTNSRAVKSRDIIGLSAEQATELAGCAKRILALGRRSTSQAFEYGKELAHAQSILPPKQFGKWLKSSCGMTTKAAKNYTRVHRELAEHRARLEKANVAPTLMFALLGAGSEAVDRVLETVENGERLTVAAVKTLVAKPKPAAQNDSLPLNVGGLRGLTKQAELKRKQDEARFMVVAERLLTAIESALRTLCEELSVETVEVTSPMIEDAREAFVTLESLIGPANSERQPDLQFRSGFMSLSEVTWDIVGQTLKHLSSADSWSDNENLTFLRLLQAHTVLAFAVEGESADQSSESLATDNLIIGDPGDHLSKNHRPTEAEWAAIETQMAYVINRLGPSATPQLEQELRAVVVDGYRMVAELNAKMTKRTAKKLRGPTRVIH